MIRMTCPNAECRHWGHFEDEQAGHHVHCPQCQAPMLLPKLEAVNAPMPTLGNPFSVPIWGGVGLVAVFAALGISVATQSPLEWWAFSTAEGYRGTGVASGDGGVPEPDGTGNRAALLIGVNQYAAPGSRGAELSNLSYAEADVEELGRVLGEAGYQTTILTGERGRANPADAPTAENIQTSLDRLLNGRGPNDVVLIAFAGHGVEPQGTFYFCPQGADLSRTDTLVSLNAVYDKLAQSQAGVKFLLADACRNDPNARTALSLKDASSVNSTRRPQELQLPGSVMAYYSCSPGEYAYEPTELRHGLFFFFVIRGLQGKADLDRDGQVHRGELTHYVNGEVRGYANRVLLKEQRPYFKGESNDHQALVTIGGAAASPLGGQNDRQYDPSLVVAEDFSLSPGGSLPQGWYGPGFRAVRDDNTGRQCVECARPRGFQYLRVPLDAPLTGDFSIEVETLLAGNPYVGGEHSLEVRLSGQRGIVVPLRLDYQGNVSIGDDLARTTKSFRSYEVNRLQLIREGSTYRLSLNDGVATGTANAYTGPVEELALGVVAGPAHLEHGESTAKVFSVKVGKLPGEAVASVDLDLPTRVLLREDFEQVPPGATLPSNEWKGEAFIIRNDDTFERPVLEVREREGIHFVTLPRLPWMGDGSIEVEFFVDGNPFAGNEQSFFVRLQGSGGNAAQAKLDYTGMATLLEGEPQQATGFVSRSVNRLRLIREGVDYRLLVNDQLVTRARGPIGEMGTVMLGLTAGRPQNGLTGKIYSIKVTAWGEASTVPNPMPQPMVRGFSEDFRLSQRGDAPDHWTVSNLNALRVFGDGQDSWLELTNDAIGDVLERSDLPGKPKATLSATFVLHARDSSLNIQLDGGASNVMLLNLKGDGTMAANGVPDGGTFAQAWKGLGQVNRLTISRDEAGHAVHINDTFVGRLPFGQVSGPFRTLRVGMARNAKDVPSPMLYAIAVSEDSD